MTEEKMQQEALAKGFTHAVFMDVKDFVFKRELRKYCEENLCGNFGKNVSCPPICGTPEEMEEKVKKYSRALVLETVNQVNNMYDAEEIKKVRKFHNDITREYIEKLRADGVEGLAMMAGPCAACEHCAGEAGGGCRFPEKLASCLSAYCVEVEKLANYCGLPYWCGENKVGFFSVYLVNR
ncbi:MAG: DUF2284 domain-containing protein [Clostridiales bacterium]|nr:DUF2284 domain-containing protein [Clostridiales bacterium]